MSRRLLLVGASTRAAAESAARAGFAVTAVDAFADADQDPRVRAIAVEPVFTPRRAVEATQAVDADAVAYLSPFENHPRAVAELVAGRNVPGPKGLALRGRLQRGGLLGNAPDVLRRVRDPLQLEAALKRHGIVSPAAWSPAPHTWILKPRRSGGGRGVRLARPDEGIGPAFYRQPFLDGVPWSIAFVAAGGDVATLGLSRQLSGDPAFGVYGFRYCGSIVESCPAVVAERATTIARAVAVEFGLVGVNGIDFMLQGDVPVPIEVNPRWSSSMEVIEGMTGESILAAHVRACEDGRLDSRRLGEGGQPALDRSGGLQPALSIGKAIIYAKRAVTVGDNRLWLADPDVRDVPRSGSRIAAGRPVCTVFAAGDTGEDCYTALVTKARAVFAQLDEWSPPGRDARRSRRRSAA